MNLLSTTARSLAGLNSFPMLQMWKPTGCGMFEPGTSFEKFVDIESLTRYRSTNSALAPKMKTSSQEEIIGTRASCCDSVYLSIYANCPPTINDRVWNPGKSESMQNTRMWWWTHQAGSHWCWSESISAGPKDGQPMLTTVSCNAENAANCIKRSLQLFFFFHPVGRIIWSCFTLKGSYLPISCVAENILFNTKDNESNIVSCGKGWFVLPKHTKGVLGVSAFSFRGRVSAD